MAERLADLDDNNGELIGSLEVFCESFVKYFEKQLNEIETVGGPHEIGKMGNNCHKFESLIGSTKCSTNHSPILIDDELRSIKDDKDFRKMLASAAGTIFWCFQNQFMLVSDNRNSVSMGMKILAFDGVSRLFDYLSSTKNNKINRKTFCKVITEGVVLGKSKTGHIIKYQNNQYYTSELYEDVGILEINQDGSKKYYNRKGSPCNFSYRFSFFWETFNDFSIKTYASGEEPTINYDLTKDELKQQLENILRIINGEDILWNINDTTTKILKKVDNNMLLVSNVATNLNNIQPTVEDIHTNIIQVKADISELKQTIKNTNENTTQIAAVVSEIIKNEATKNDQHVLFDMRKPVTTFTGRIEILKELHQTLHQTTGSIVISQKATSISGLGGIGKSELSRKYAFEYQNAYDGNLIWINSENHESLKDSFTRLAQQLKIPVIDTEQKEKVRDVASIVEDVYTRLGKGKCLFIFDNAEEYKIIKKFLPLRLSSDFQTPHILITSRNQKWQFADTGAIDVINLEYFTSDEALVFIKNALDIKNNSTNDEIKILAKELDYFPLALGQAVAYINMKDEREKKFRGETFGVSDYLKAYKDELFKTKLLKHRHENSQYNKTVLTTWNITLENIEEENKNSIKIIEIMAYLVPDSIDPDVIFSKLIKDEEKREDTISNKITKIMAYVFPDSIKPDVSSLELRKDEEKREAAIELLLKYSMINIKDRVLSIHRLVQEVIRLQIQGKGKETDVLKKVLKLLEFDLRIVDEMHLISVWSYACNYGKIIDEFFFKYKRYGENTTPLHLIVESGNIDAVKKILNHLKKKSNEKLQEILNSKKYPYRTPLEFFIKQNNLEMVQLLIEFGAEKDKKICVEAIFDGFVDIVKYLYPNNDECLQNAKFYSAFRSENVESVNNLLKDLKKGQIINIMERKITSVDPKLINKSPPLFIAAQRGNLDLVKLFIKYGADINASYGLHVAVDNGHYEIFKFLIENGANCNAVNNFDKIVLHVTDERDQFQFLKYLINNEKCDINATYEWGWIALHEAAKGGKLELMKYLINNKKFDINVTNSWGWTALHVAAECGQLEIVKYLINTNKFDINVTNRWGETALHLAVKGGKLEIVNYLINTNKFDINVTNSWGWTALHLAAKGGKLEIVNFLINTNKFDINATNKIGETALDLATESNHSEVVEYLTKLINPHVC